MNIFILDTDPTTAARMHCDKHVPKMCVEAAQMMASALRRHGATDEQMPLTKSGTPYKGGYAHHPCTVWVGDRRENFDWLANHAIELCRELQLASGRWTFKNINMIPTLLIVAVAAVLAAKRYRSW